MVLRRIIMKKNIILGTSVVLILLLCLASVMVFAADNSNETGSIANRWDVHARTFNIAGKPIIYDTTMRDRISIVLQKWTTDVELKCIDEISLLQAN
jgi:hypothetical protein